MTLTNKQLAKIFAAQESGVSKREMFEADVSEKRITNLSKEDHDRFLADLDAGKPIPSKFLIGRKMKVNKALAIIELKRDKEAKEAFLKQDTLRLQSFRAEALR